MRSLTRCSLILQWVRIEQTHCVTEPDQLYRLRSEVTPAGGGGGGDHSIHGFMISKIPSHAMQRKGPWDGATLWAGRRTVDEVL